MEGLVKLFVDFLLFNYDRPILVLRRWENVTRISGFCPATSFLGALHGLHGSILLITSYSLFQSFNGKLTMA